MLKYLILLCDFIWWPLQLIWKQAPSTCSVHAQQVLNICIDIGYLHDVNHAYKHLMMKLAKRLCWNGMWFHTTDKSGRTCLSSNRPPTFTAGYIFVQEVLHSTPCNGWLVPTYAYFRQSVHTLRGGYSQLMHILDSLCTLWGVVSPNLCIFWTVCVHSLMGG